MTPDPLLFESYSKRMKLPVRLERARSIADTILAHFDRHFRIFSEISAMGREHFTDGDWAAGRAAARSQISLYDKRVLEAIADLKKHWSQSYLDTRLWQDVKHQYLGLLYRHQQPELAETFYNSLFTGLFERHYYNNEYIFVRPAISTERIESSEAGYKSYYPTQDGWNRSVLGILRDTNPGLPYENIRRDARNIVQRLRTLPSKNEELRYHFQLQVLIPAFYRNKAAYIVGRAINGAEKMPFVIAVCRTPDGRAYVDTLVTDVNVVANIFSFSRAHFLVKTDVPSTVVRFLASILPSKTSADLYTAIGFHKQGKAEFYRDFLDHLRHSSDMIRIAPGIRGLVMLVFTLPSYPFVFKLIKDRFPAPKDTTPQKVISQYRLVKKLDRVGRMADTWEFSYVAFPIDRFDPDLLDELEKEAPSQVIRERDQIIIRQLFIEHRMTPLNVYLDHHDMDAACQVLTDYGQAIKDISGSGIFPGDLLTKNFGVTRHGRVIFYDYDEIIPMEKCCFRKIPPPRFPEDEMSDTPWYTVAPNDIFPEEFLIFLVANPAYRKALKNTHPELFQAEYWQKLQQAVASGFFPDVIPYPEESRFKPTMVADNLST